jgi:hypothetical protein
VRGEYALQFQLDILESLLIISKSVSKYLMGERYRRKRACCKVIPSQCHLQGIYLIWERKAIKVLMTSLIRPAPSIHKGKNWFGQVLFDDVVEFGPPGSTHEQDLTWLEDANLGNSFDIGLTVTDLA